MKKINYNKTRGFTLIEALIVISIAMIILTSAIPAFSQIISKNRQSALLYNLFSHHQLARSEAIKTNQRITLCKSSNQTQCTSGSQWHDGWIVFVDNNHNKIINGNERVIHIQQALDKSLTLKYRGFGSQNYISYFSSGWSTSNGTFTLCSQANDTTAESIIISRTGRARIDNKSSTGEALECL